MSIRNLVNLVNTTMPYAWDDSLSVYEMLGKLISKINEMVELINLKIPDDFDDRYADMLRTYTEEELMNLLENGLLETFFTEFSEAIEAVGAEFQIDFDTLTGQFSDLQSQFDNVVANVTVDSEVILARGTKPTLGERLDAADKGEVGYIMGSDSVPNYDTATKTLTFKGTSNYVIIHRDKFYSIPFGTTLTFDTDFRNDPIYTTCNIYFDTSDSLLKLFANDSLKYITKTMVLIGTYRNVNNKVTFNMNCDYAIDNKLYYLNNIANATIEKVYLRHGNYHYKAEEYPENNVRLTTTSTRIYWAFKDNNYYDIDLTEFQDFILENNKCFVLNIATKTLRITDFGGLNRVDPVNDVILLSNVDGKLTGHLYANIIEHQYLYQDNTKLLPKDINTSGRELICKLSVPTSPHMQSFTFVDNELWVFATGVDDHSTFAPVNRYTIDIENGIATKVGSFNHNFGHCNSTSYCKQTNSLILGNGGGADNLEPNEFYIFENADSFKGLSQVELENYAIRINVASLNWGKQLNVVWGDSNGGKHNIAYAISQDGVKRYIKKLLLGQGANQFENGVFISGKTGLQFNGTFKVLKEYSKPYVYEEYNNGTDWHNGVIYEGLGAHYLWYSENTLLDDGSIKTKQIKETLYGDDGEKLSWSTTPSIEVEGLTIKDNLLYLGNVTNEIFVYKL